MLYIVYVTILSIQKKEKSCIDVEKHKKKRVVKIHKLPSIQPIMSIMSDDFAPADADDRVFNACCCCNQLISFDFAKVIGCQVLNECICLKQECCCKVGVKPKEILFGSPVVLELLLCKIGLPCCSIGIQQPKPLIKGKGECFCFRNKCALPPDDDTPMMFGLYGLTCFPKPGCCVKYSEAK